MPVAYAKSNAVSIISGSYIVRLAPLVGCASERAEESRA
jgi:propanediol dehydratase large subunit